MSEYSKWYHPYKPDPKYKKRVAYFSMEFAVDQVLKIYSGGLGFLAGSHMRSAYRAKQNLVGIGMLWKFGYYDQARKSDQSLDVNFTEKNYNFLEDTGITVDVAILDNPHVKVKAYVLKPEIFGTIPLYLLSTDLPENDHLSRTITDRLYDANELTRISQSIVLGIGGAKVVEALGGADVYHLNEGHGLPAFFYLKDQGLSKDHFAFTTHTPERAGNEERDGNFLNNMGFFGRKLSETELKEVTVNNGMLSYTVAALRLAKISNAVSQLHAEVSQDMWKEFDGISKIIPITNAQNQYFWQDTTVLKSWEKGNVKSYQTRKKELKKELFREVANQTGKIFDVDVLTLVWARRFAGYKRADLLLYDLERFNNILYNAKEPIQVIWAGKPYPFDYSAIET
ncbi:MAG: alpha-glucan family phosphorylase, partial [Bacteroidota bacterium]